MNKITFEDLKPVHNQVNNQLEKQIWGQIWSQIWNEVILQQCWTQLSDRLRELVMVHIRRQLWDQLYE